MEFFQNFGLREMVIGTAVLLGIYSGIVIIRLSRLPRRPETARKQGAAQAGQQAMQPGIEAELGELRAEVAALREKVSRLEAASRSGPNDT